MQRELVDEDPAAGAAHRGERDAWSRRTVGRCSFGFSSSADRGSGSCASPPTRPAASSTRTNDGRRVAGARCQHRGPARSRTTRSPARRRASARRLDLDLARRGDSGSRARDACAGRRRRPAGSRSGRSARSSDATGRARRARERARRRRRRRVELPDERGPVDRGGAETRLVARRCRRRHGCPAVVSTPVRSA